eukprot:3904911-Prymnesium_polylepis.1
MSRHRHPPRRRMTSRRACHSPVPSTIPRYRLRSAVTPIPTLTHRLGHGARGAILTLTRRLHYS